MKKKLFLQIVFVFFISMIITIETKAQAVSPLQTGHYLAAFSNVRDMAAPPPGLFVLWYNYYSVTKSYYDRNGNKFNTIPLNEIDDRLPAVDLDVDLQNFATAPAIFWAANKKIFGARYMAGVVPVYFWADASILTEAKGGVNDTAFMSSETAKLNGFSDMYVAPVTLSWALNQFDLTVSYGFTAPTGRYETGADDNIGLGFWTHQLQGFGYWYPVEDQSTALMLGATYEITTKVKDTDFNPGNRFTLEWGISQYLSDRLEVAIQGGHNWQVSEDTGEDIFWDPSVKDKKSTIGFNLAYWVWPEHMQITAKYGLDFGLVQRFSTNMFMINLTYVPNILTGNK